MNPLQGADIKKLNKIGKYLPLINLEILQSRVLNDDMIVGILQIGSKMNDITFKVSNQPDIDEFVENCFNGEFGKPNKFELDYVRDLIRESKNLYYKKHCLNL